MKPNSSIILAVIVALAAAAAPAAAAPSSSSHHSSAPRAWLSHAPAPLRSTNANAYNGGGAPWFCHDLDCPAFTVTEANVTSDPPIELRHYPAAKYVSTSVTGAGYDKAVAQGFWRLFKYISGANAGGVKVKMTAPVTVRVLAGQGPACEDDFTVSFYLPPDHQAAPPAPTAPEVFIEARPALDVYVASFGGWAKGTTWLAKAGDAAAALERAGAQVDGSFFYTAGYDSPFRLTGRHNEVWLPAVLPAALP